MVRRTVPRINPEVDYSGIFFEQDDLDPWQPAEWFGRQAPLEVEVGSGKGLFLMNFGQRYPEHNFLGIEIAKKFAQFAASRIAKRGLSHVRVAAANGVEVFRLLIPDASVAAVHVYFPDPWWKARHKKRRVLHEEFLAHIQRVLIPEGKLHFWTDVLEYFQSTLELIGSHTQLEGPFAVAELQPEHDLDYRTHRERRIRLEGGAIYRSEFRKSVPQQQVGGAAESAPPSG